MCLLVEICCHRNGQNYNNRRSATNFKNKLNYYLFLGTCLPRNNISESKLTFALHILILQPQTFENYHPYRVIQNQVFTGLYPYLALTQNKIHFEKAECPVLGYKGSYCCKQHLILQDSCTLQLQEENSPAYRHVSKVFPMGLYEVQISVN